VELFPLSYWSYDAAPCAGAGGSSPRSLIRPDEPATKSNRVRKPFRHPDLSSLPYVVDFGKVSPALLTSRRDLPLTPPSRWRASGETSFYTPTLNLLRYPPLPVRGSTGPSCLMHSDTATAFLPYTWLVCVCDHRLTPRYSRFPPPCPSSFFPRQLTPLFEPKRTALITVPIDFASVAPFPIYSFSSF